MGQVIPTLTANCFPFPDDEHREMLPRETNEAVINDIKIKIKALEQKLLTHFDMKLESLEHDMHSRLELLNEKILRLDDKIDSKIEVPNYRLS